MRKSILFFVFISLLNISCSKDSVNDPGEQKVLTGTVTFKVNKESTSSEFNYVVTILSRSGHDDIIDSINVNTSSTGLSSFKLATGTWFLTTKSINKSNVVVDSQRVELPVYEDHKTDINIDLSDYVSLKISWGSADFNEWYDYNQNPVLSPVISAYDDMGVQQPKVLYDGGKYKMWYMGLTGGSRGVVCYAESEDGLSWTRPAQNPVMSNGSSGSWDATSSIAGAILKEDSVYRMYYAGWNNQNSTWSIGLAISNDGINWNKYQGPVLSGTTGWETKVVPSSIIKIDSKYYLYYYGIGAGVINIGLAVSSDGYTFTKYSGNPILTATEDWEGTGVYHPSVFKDGNVYKMVYSGRSANAFGTAISDDGIRWIKSNSNPFFESKQSHNSWASGSAAYPCYIKVNKESRIYYSGLNDSPNYKIGVAIKR